MGRTLLWVTGVTVVLVQLTTQFKLLPYPWAPWVAAAAPTAWVGVRRALATPAERARQSARRARLRQRWRARLARLRLRG